MAVLFLIFILLCIALAFGCIHYSENFPDRSDRSVEPAKEHKMTFGTTIDSASYRFPTSYLGSIDLESSQKEIDLAKELGVDYVRFDIRNEMLGYPKEVEKLDELVRYARSKNLKIYLGVYGMETWSSSIFSMVFTHKEGGDGKASWDDFRIMYSGEVDTLMKRYNPDYMMIMVECPYNIGNQVSSKRSDEQWVEYTMEVAQSIKNMSSNKMNKTKVVLGLTARRKSSPTSIDFIELLMKKNDSNIDIIGIHPYSLEELEDEMESISWLKDKYKWPGDVWIDETNTFPYKSEEYQNKYLKYALNLSIKNPEIKGFCIFRLRDTSDDPGGNYGIVNKDFSKKMAYPTVQDIIRSNKNLDL